MILILRFIFSIAQCDYLNDIYRCFTVHSQNSFHLRFRPQSPQANGMANIMIMNFKWNAPHKKYIYGNETTSK